MTATEVLDALGESEELQREVVAYLDHGFRDEWDCGLPDALKLFGPGREFSIAARTGAGLARYHEQREAILERADEIADEHTFKPIKEDHDG